MNASMDDTDDPSPAAASTDRQSARGASTDRQLGEVEELRAELADKHDRLLRALAETDNVRRRAQRERDDYVRYATEGLLRDLIPVLDNLDRALAAARTPDPASGLLEGVELIQRELLRVLERAGVARYSALGVPFDPTRHEAIARVASTEAAPGTVVAETLPGYSLRDRVLRAAMVSVAEPPEEDAA